jgi:hypothetical protein
MRSSRCRWSERFGLTGADNDDLLCVQLVAADGSLATLLDWEKLIATNTWVTRTASLTD